MSPSKKKHTIIFRITDEEMERVQAAARAQGKDVNDWSRAVTLAQADQPAALTPVERLIFEQLAVIRYMVSHGLGLLAGNQESSPAWEKIKLAVREKSPEIAAALLARHAEGGRQS